MLKSAAILCAVIACVAALQMPTGELSGKDLADFVMFPKDLAVDASPNEIFTKWTKNLYHGLDSIVAPEVKEATQDGYFDWIPVFLGAIPVNNTAFTWSTKCFQTVTANVAFNANSGSGIMTIDFASQSHAACTELYFISTVKALHAVEATTPKKHILEWKGDLSAAEISWVQRNGYRVFRFNNNTDETVGQLLATVSLFFPALERADIPEDNMKRNLEFLATKAYYNMSRRVIEDVILDESLINDGDFFGVIRLDGLDPTLAWAMGAHTGHTTIALRFDGELYICESTTFSNYWPTGGIQRTPYLQWIAQAKNATYNVVHLPLSAESRAKFNSTAAVEWFYTVQGLEYGFHNMLFSWIDTAEANYPFPLVSETHEVLIGWVEQISAGLAMLMWDSAFNMRIGTTNLSTAEVYDAAYAKGLTFEELFALPEQDEWKYSRGYSMVCDVLVCETWKNGGLFGDLADQIQCTEFTNFDAYALNIFDTNYIRPIECQVADPDSEFCQILGPYRMSLPFYNSRQMSPDMAQNCPRGPPPNFPKPVGC